MKVKQILPFVGLLVMTGGAASMGQNTYSTAPTGTNMQPPAQGNNDLNTPANTQGTGSSTSTATGTGTTGSTTGSSDQTGTPTSTSTTTKTDTTGSRSGQTTTPSGGRLPRTASELPLVAAIGLMALGAGVFLRGLKRSA